MHQDRGRKNDHPDEVRGDNSSYDLRIVIIIVLLGMYINIVQYYYYTSLRTKA